MTSGWNSQILTINQLTASLTFEFASEYIFSNLSSAELSISRNFYFSGPSAIHPRAISAEYFFLQSASCMFAPAKFTTVSITSFLMKRASFCRQNPADRACPHSSSSPSSSNVIFPIPKRIRSRSSFLNL